MPIWFVYRSPYAGPLSKHVRRLDGADTLLDWFRFIWRPIADRDEAAAHAEQLFGTAVCDFHSLFVNIAEDGLPPPEDMEDVHHALEAALYLRSHYEYRGTDDTIQIASDDNDYGLIYYWFTDAFARRHPERVAYLLHDDWRLPQALGPGGFRPKPGVERRRPPVAGPEALYLLRLDLSRVSHLDELLPAEKLPGVRLPDLAPWLLRLSDAETEKCGTLLSALRDGLLRVLAGGEGLEASFRRSLAADPADDATWAAYSDWLAEQDRPRAELHLLTLACWSEAHEVAPEQPLHLQVGPHSLVLLLPWGDADEFEQWYLFDDVWASGNVDLANALLDYAGRYNVLDDWHVASDYLPGIPAGEEHDRAG